MRNCGKIENDNEPATQKSKLKEFNVCFDLRSIGRDNFEKKNVEFCTNYSKGFLNCASKSDFVFEIIGKT